ncbi:hypothetical protein SAMN05428949_6525 [Chitinophaga sp. YR627]|uniref:hypothetical protein n=1 Tax=Chitinophaga sp. YR627 TaxID=1881041 RepID=UPI0008EF7783|nr:hypothetical protein [Chitinophaga sp. YR627]SFO76056.1 hypothetical protein SAMN05428949_6525 [Chitinophaga sp. YR627]
MKQFFFIPLLLIVSLLHAQEISFSGNCGPSGKTSYPPATRMKHYPFNEESEVRLISFDGLVEISDRDTFKVRSMDPVLLGDPAPPADTIKENLRLTQSQVDTLTNILFNYGYGTHRPKSTSVVDCFDPRNAILFFDKNGKALAYIAICYQCRKASVSNERIIIGDACLDKLQLLKKFFKEGGIKYGVE